MELRRYVRYWVLSPEVYRVFKWSKIAIDSGRTFILRSWSLLRAG